MNYKDFAINLARNAGQIIKSEFTLGMKKEWKADTTPVTEADLKINQLVMDEVNLYYPEHSLHSEEESNYKESDYMWVCDPIDGTIPFSHGVPTCVFSLALVHKGQPILGVIYDPFIDRLFFAEKGKGAFLNGQPIKVSKAPSLYQESGKLVMNVSFWLGTEAIMQPLFDKLKKLNIILIDVCSIVYMGALVASGEFVAIVFPGTAPHDSAAIKIIVEEAGGKATDILGNEQRYDRNTNGLVATNGLIHDELIGMIKSLT